MRTSLFLFSFFTFSLYSMQDPNRSRVQITLDKRANAIKLQPSCYEKFKQEHPTAHKRIYTTLYSGLSTLFIVGATSIARGLLHQKLDGLKGETMETYVYPLIGISVLVPTASIISSFVPANLITHKLLHKIEPRKSQEAKMNGLITTCTSTLAYAAYLIYKGVNGEHDPLVPYRCSRW